MYEKNFSTIINLVNSSSSSAETGDYCFILILLLIFSAIIMFAFLYKKIKVASRISIVVVLGISLFLVFNRGLFASANEVDDEYLNVNVPQFVDSELKDGKVNVSQYSIKNCSLQETAIIKSIKISKLNEKFGGKWTIVCNDLVIYDNEIDSDYTDCDVTILPGQSVVLNISSEFASENFYINDNIAKIDYCISNPDICTISGQVSCSKAINSDKTILSDINVQLENNKTGSTSAFITQNDGNFNFFVKKSSDYTIKVESPGVVPFSYDVDLVDNNTFVDVNLHGLDFYSLDELKIASQKLSELNNLGEDVLKSSDIYKEFYRYMGSDIQEEIIWYSNSMGKQKDKDNLDPNLCNPLYKNNFEVDIDIEKKEIDQYLFLRIMGVCHDYKTSNHGEKAGLTFNSIHSLPKGYVYGDENKGYYNCWDVDYLNRTGSYVHEALQNNGYIYNQINENFKNNLISVDKPYTKKHNSAVMDWSHDLFFILSYPELYKYDPSQVYFADWFRNNDPSGKFTEGYMYEWTDSHNICGYTDPPEKRDINKSLWGIEKTNSNQSISLGRGTMLLRNSCNMGMLADIKVHTLGSKGNLLGVIPFDEEAWSVNLCFCF